MLEAGGANSKSHSSCS